METLKNLSGTQKFIIGLILGLILGWGGTYFALNQGGWGALKCNPGETPADCAERIGKAVGDMVKNGNSEENEDEEMVSTGTPSTSVEVSGTNAVAVNDQLSGSLVEVTMVTLSKAGWVVIHEDNPLAPGMPGKVLGARRYEPGIYLGEVELLRATESGKTYYAMLHLDDGDKQFDLSKDLPILGEDGKVIMATFKAQ